MKNDLYAAIPPRERKYHSDTQLSRLSAVVITRDVLLLFIPAGAIIIFRYFHGASVFPLLFVSMFLVLITYFFIHSIRSGFVQTLQNGIFLRRSEPIRYWIHVGILTILYLLLIISLCLIQAEQGAAANP